MYISASLKKGTFQKYNKRIQKRRTIHVKYVHPRAALHRLEGVQLNPLTWEI